MFVRNAEAIRRNNRANLETKSVSHRASLALTSKLISATYLSSLISIKSCIVKSLHVIRWNYTVGPIFRPLHCATIADRCRFNCQRTSLPVSSSQRIGSRRPAKLDNPVSDSFLQLIFEIDTLLRIRKIARDLLFVIVENLELSGRKLSWYFFRY